MPTFTIYVHPEDHDLQYLKSVEQRFELGGLVFGPLWVAYKRGPLGLVLLLLFLALAPLLFFGANIFTASWAALIWALNSRSHAGLQSIRLKQMGYHRAGDVHADSRAEAEARFKGGGPSSIGRTMLDEVQDKGGALIVHGYRKFANEHGCAPTSATSDQDIIRTYMKVGSAFRAASQKRGENISAGVLNRIVLNFLQARELLGDAMMDQHLQYEVQKYLNEGLRQDYKQEIRLF
jgi:hypothetical protein